MSKPGLGWVMNGQELERSCEGGEVTETQYITGNLKYLLIRRNCSSRDSHNRFIPGLACFLVMTNTQKAMIPS